ncbi:unnamed protein product [Adineta steineri]|uniref:Uncharacterized protein n=1 Tax=Adineta steineri TaxID=433720 RepID=A0A814EV99_9BILA|nr:unnamed protein product [Adineta steineri]CAF0974504.1 unnamed protein product [Adineta steineri]CAF1058454.1 unnamed protein product [Adineta steineri]
MSTRGGQQEKQPLSSHDPARSDRQRLIYHTVPIRSELPKISKSYAAEPSKDLPSDNFWTDVVQRTNTNDAANELPGAQSHTTSTAQYKLLYSKANGPYTHADGSHPILTAFLNAYNSHEDIILSPDDIWLMVCIGFSKYVNDNAEKLRHFFVDHDGKKELTVTHILDKPNWNRFLEDMRLEVNKNVKNDVCDLLSNNFSTTTQVESLVSCVAIMTTFKKYFDYDYCVAGCGIRNVHFMGTLDDWKLLQEKTRQLQSFSTPEDEFATYITGLLPILNQCIQTYEGKVDNQFWDTIFDLKHRNGMSGMKDGTYVNGWFLRLCYGNHWDGSYHMEDIKLNSLVVPVKVKDENVNESKMCYFAGGFHGVDSYDGMHKPVMSLAIVEDSNSIQKLY